MWPVQMCPVYILSGPVYIAQLIYLLTPLFHNSLTCLTNTYPCPQYSFLPHGLVLSKQGGVL